MFCLCYEKNTDNTPMLGLLLNNVYSESSIVLFAMLCCQAGALEAQTRRRNNCQQKLQLDKVRTVNGLPEWTQRKFSQCRGRLGNEEIHNNEASKSSASDRSWLKDKLNLNHGNYVFAKSEAHMRVLFIFIWDSCRNCRCCTYSHSPIAWKFIMMKAQVTVL